MTNEGKPKSILDGIPVDDKAFPMRQNVPQLIVIPQKVVTGQCPRCGAPIYGPKELAPGTAPDIVYSCCCVPQPMAGLEHRTK